MDIVTIHSTQSKYFVASRKFELPELKLLIDCLLYTSIMFGISRMQEFIPMTWYAL